MDSEEKCLFGCKRISEKLICGGTDRIKSIIQASISRNDKRFTSLDPVVPVKFHKVCVSTYTSKHHIKRVLSSIAPESLGEPSIKRLCRSHVPEFNFRSDCLYCGKLCLERDPRHPERWRKYYQVRTTSRPGQMTLQESILRMCDTRGDKFAEMIRVRIFGAIGDLHAADARYHKDCHDLFMHSKLAKKPALQAENLVDEGIQKVISIMTDDTSIMWNSIELYELYKSNGGNKISRRTLIATLQENIGPELLVLSSAGVASIIVFRKYASSFMKIVDDVEDVDYLVHNLSRKIKSELQSVKRDSRKYVTRVSQDQLCDNISPSLHHLLLETGIALLPSTLIGHIALSQISYQPTNLQIALGLMLHSKNVIQEFYKFGVTCSYDECRRFKISAAAAAANDAVARGLSGAKECFVQAVGDNFDTTISSQNGLQQTHCMALLMTQAVPRNSNALDKYDEIKRLPKCDTSQPVNKPIPVHHFYGEKKPVMPLQASLRGVPPLNFLASQVCSLRAAWVKDFLFLKSIINNEGSTPEFGGFNTKLARDENVMIRGKTRTIYTPLLHMMPSHPDTIFTSMKEVQRLTKETEQEYTFFTCDQQLYKIVVGIQWTHAKDFEKFIPRLGGMHMLMSFVGSVGVLMADSGLSEIMQSAFAGVEKMLIGKKFPQNVRGLRLVAEEVLREVLEDEGVSSFEHMIQVLDNRAQQSRTAKLWIDCLVKPVLIMMLFIRAEREGNWSLHLLAAESMLVYFMSAGHWNYVRSSIVYITQMSNLSFSNCKKLMENGNHVMRHQDGIWNGVWSDMYIESTFMRNGKGPGGLKGITLQPKTVAVWALSLHIVSQLIKDIEDLCINHDEADVVLYHKEEGMSRIKSDSADRLKIREKLSMCISPLNISQTVGLVNIVTGTVANKEVNVDRAVELGEQALSKFKSSLPGGYYKPLKKSVITMQSMRKSLKVDNTDIYDISLIYSRISCLMLSRDISIESALLYELSPIPASMFDESGSFRPNTSKSVLKNKLSVEVSGRMHAHAEVVVIDGCASLWSVHWPNGGSLVHYVENFWSFVHKCLRESDVYIVFDRYQDYSMKSCTRSSRAAGSTRNYHLMLTAPIPPRSLVLTNTHNKVQLIDILCNHMISSAAAATINNKLIITGRDAIPTEVCCAVQIARTDLLTTHEEADVIIVQQVMHAVCHTNANSICVVSDDTDVFLLLCHYYNHLALTCQLTMEATSGERRKIDIAATVEKHRTIVPQLLKAHALSGCDTVAYLYGIGKG